MTVREPIHPEIPVSMAWRAPDGWVYVATSMLDRQHDAKLRQLGGIVDPEVRGARAWRGDNPRIERVIEYLLPRAPAAASILREAAQERQRREEERRQRRREMVARGWLIRLDEEEAICDAYDLGAELDLDSGQFALPDEAALNELRGRISKRRARDAPAPAASTVEEVIAASGRTVNGEQGSRHGRLDVRRGTKRAAAEAAKPRLGAIVRLGRHRRAMIVESTVDFYGPEDSQYPTIEDVYPGERPGWWWEITFVEVAPTGEEQAADDRRAAVEADQAAVKELLRRARHADGWRYVDTFATPTGAAVIWRGAPPHTWSQRLVETADGLRGQALPGYDDSGLREAEITDPELVTAFVAVIAAGPRVLGDVEVTERPA